MLKFLPNYIVKNTRVFLLKLVLSKINSLFSFCIQAESRLENVLEWSTHKHFVNVALLVVVELELHVLGGTAARESFVNFFTKVCVFVFRAFLTS